MRELAPDTIERNYAKEPLARAEVAAIVRAAGSVAAVLNTRHRVAKEEGWKESPPAAGRFAEAVLREPNLLRRPILVSRRHAVVGNDEEGIRRLLASSQ